MYHSLTHESYIKITKIFLLNFSYSENILYLCVLKNKIMTRINSAIPIRMLSDEHLLAEHREIKRLPSCVEKSLKSGSIKNIPDKFVLGQGHVLFFLNKQKFIYKRYKEIYDELLRRGFNIEDYSTNWDKLKDSELWNDYVPTLEERDLLVERISTRIRESNKEWFHYYKKKISKENTMLIIRKERLCEYDLSLNFVIVFTYYLTNEAAMSSLQHSGASLNCL